MERDHHLVATLNIGHGERSSFILKGNPNSLVSELYEKRELCGKD
jgi:hypothetical protein